MFIVILRVLQRTEPKHTKKHTSIYDSIKMLY